MLKSGVLFLLGLILSGSVGLAAEYGVATICTGKMTVLRAGRRFDYQEADSPVRIRQNDLIRVRGASVVLFHTVEKTTMRLGGNTILEVRVWRRKGKSGQVRVLYGRVVVMRAAGPGRFNIRTGTAVVSGRDGVYTLEVNARGDTMVAVHSRTVKRGMRRC